MASSCNLITLAEIPTLSQLYQSGELEPADHDGNTVEPSAAINSKISIIRTSITDLEVTSIVNAANNSLLGGGGVDGAIHAAAGPQLLAECRTLDGCDTGSAKITAAYEMPSQYVVHAVGPIYAREKRKRNGLQAELLESCYRTSLELAAEKGGSIAFSCLSTGVYGYPSDEAAEIACETVREFLGSGEGQKLERVIFCCFLEKDLIEYEEILPVVFPPSKEELQARTSAHGDSAGAAVEDLEDDKWETVEKPESTADDETNSAAGLNRTGATGLDKPLPGNFMAGLPVEATSVQSEKPLENRLAKDW
ncbi:MAG: hypothetical protein Q9218_006026 [Villophora microphyllina]